MKRVLIADDEYLVRIGLKTTIDWGENGFEIVGIANNGKDAIDLFEKTDPDILLTDIRMPVLDGLELIQVLKLRKPFLKIVIMSHYDEFKYAREAIKLGASEYLLKSDLNNENLLAILRRISAEIDRENIKQPSGSTDENEAAEATTQKRLDDFALRIVKGELVSKTGIELFLSGKENNFGFENIILASGIFQESREPGEEPLPDLILGNIRLIAEQELSNRHYESGIVVDHNRIILVVCSDDTSGAKGLAEYILDICQKIRSNVRQYVAVNITFGISHAGSSLNEAAALYGEASIAQMSTYFDSEDICVYSDTTMGQCIACPRLELQQLRSLVLDRNVERLNAFLVDLFGILAKAGRHSYVEDIFMDLLSFARILSKEMKWGNARDLTESKFSYSNFASLHDFLAVRQYILDLYSELINLNLVMPASKYSYPINRCIDYIKRNYADNITLSNLAEEVEMSKSYLSLLFKQETGINFSVYLNQHRVGIAKELLSTTNLKIYEVSERVGFENPYYFSKVFHEISGMTCKNFRNAQVIGGASGEIDFNPKDADSEFGL